MLIILEGADNSGKSTLAAEFEKLGATVHPSGGPPKNDEDLLHRMKKHAALLHDHGRIHVLDRTPCISQHIYSKAGDSLIQAEYRRRMLFTQTTLLLYCRPTTKKVLDFSTHVAKAYDTPEHIKYVEDNAVEILSRYDKFMREHPHLRFNYETDDVIEFASSYFKLCRSERYLRVVKAFAEARYLVGKTVVSLERYVQTKSDGHETS